MEQKKTNKEVVETIKKLVAMMDGDDDRFTHEQHEKCYETLDGLYAMMEIYAGLPEKGGEE